LNIGIVGNGLVGSTAAYAIIMRGLGRKIVDVILHDQRSILDRKSDADLNKIRKKADRLKSDLTRKTYL
jgi:3-hydroxyacyl-CoA dehydrogenase